MCRARCAALAAALTCAVAGCDGGDDEPVGSFLVLVKDQPIDDLLSFRITITSVVLDPGGVQVLPSSRRLELTDLRLGTSVLRLAAISPGMYDSVTIRFANPRIRFLEGGVVRQVDPPLESSSVTETIDVTLAENGAAGIVIDFDIEGSILTDPSDDITGVDPTLSVSEISVGAEEEIEGSFGRVLAINRTGAATGTLGAILFEDFSSCGSISVRVTSDTVFDGFEPAANRFSSLATGRLIELDADFRSDGRVVAEKIDLEDDEVEDELEGVIVSVERDAGGLVLEFDLVPLRASPCSAVAPSASRVTVTVPRGLELRVDDDGFDLTGFSFSDLDDLDIGQKVEVDPVGILTSTTTAITVEEIRLTDQTVHGTAGSILDDEFALAPSSSLFPDALIRVVTSGATRVDDPPVDGEDVLVRGLLFRIGPGEQVLVAKRVDGTP